MIGIKEYESNISLEGLKIQSKIFNGQNPPEDIVNFLQSFFNFYYDTMSYFYYYLIHRSKLVYVSNLVIKLRNKIEFYLTLVITTIKYIVDKKGYKNPDPDQPEIIQFNPEGDFDIDSIVNNIEKLFNTKDVVSLRQNGNVVYDDIAESFKEEVKKLDLKIYKKFI